MTHDTSTAQDRRGASLTLHPRVAAFLAAYEAGPGAMTAEQTDELIDLTDSMKRMHVLDSPFMFGTIDGFFPDEIFQAVLRDWPAESALATVALQAEGDPATDYFGSRKTKLLENWAAGVGCPYSETWNRVSSALRAPALVRSMFARFADVIESNLDSLNVSTSNIPSFKLYANFDQGVKEALGAHVDALCKLLTIVVYLDLSGDLTDESARSWGTALYDAKPGAVEPLSFSSNADHSVAHQIEFAVNRAFVMPNTSRALHGVAGGQKGVLRRTLMCGYWLTPHR
jgi:hypothetical protein